MRKKKGSAEVSIDTSCPLPTFEDYHRFTMLDPQSKYKGHEGYVIRNWFPASTMPFVVDKLGQIEDLMDKYEIKNIEELEKKLKVFEIIKTIDFSLEFDDSQNEWFLYLSNEEHCVLVAKGAGVKTYALLKEVL